MCMTYTKENTINTCFLWLLNSLDYSSLQVNMIIITIFSQSHFYQRDSQQIQLQSSSGSEMRAGYHDFTLVSLSVCLVAWQLTYLSRKLFYLSGSFHIPIRENTTRGGRPMTKIHSKTQKSVKIPPVVGGLCKSAKIRNTTNLKSCCSFSDTVNCTEIAAWLTETCQYTLYIISTAYHTFSKTSTIQNTITSKAILTYSLI